MDHLDTGPLMKVMILKDFWKPTTMFSGLSIRMMHGSCDGLLEEQLTAEEKENPAKAVEKVKVAEKADEGFFDLMEKESQVKAMAKERKERLGLLRMMANRNPMLTGIKAKERKEKIKEKVRKAKMIKAKAKLMGRLMLLMLVSLLNLNLALDL